MRVVFIDLDLSIKVSVPIDKRPIYSWFILYFCIKLCTTDKQILLMSSKVFVKDISY